jgi:two-component system, response regulator PdtaR
VPNGTTAEALPDSPMVMVVEDEFLIAMDLEFLLASNGWRVLGPAATVTNALALLESQTPDIALLDVNLRGETVTPVAEALRDRGVPFLVTSAYDKAQLAARGLVGMPRLTKPVNEDKLLAALAEAVAR